MQLKSRLDFGLSALALGIGLSGAVALPAHASGDLFLVVNAQSEKGEGFVDGAKHSLQAAFSDVILGIDSSATARATGQATNTAQKLGVFASSSGQWGGSARALSQVSDLLNFNVGGYAGPIDVAYRIFIEGTTTADCFTAAARCESNAFWQLVSRVDGITNLAVDSSRTAFSDGLSTTRAFSETVNGVTGSATGVHLLTMRAHTNFSVGMGLRLEATATAGSMGAGSSASAGVNLGNSVYWAGITSVTTPDGLPLDFTVSSASGADYSRSYVPVPEPATTLLMALGLLVLPWRHFVSARVARLAGSLALTAAPRPLHQGAAPLACSG